jgi:hypothetical protein
LTKQISDENTLKYQTALAEANKVDITVTNMIDDHPLAICNTHDSLGKEGQLETVPIEVEMKSETSGTGGILRELFNLENWIASEKPVKIELDLDLYQMEKF